MNRFAEPHSRIFLRANARLTSLAGYILGSHPQINGYYEMHISYEDASALDKQLDVFLESDVFKENSRYLSTSCCTRLFVEARESLVLRI